MAFERIAQKNSIVKIIFEVLSSDGVTPLTGQASLVTKTLRKEGGAAPETVTITEQGTSGYYEASFTPLSGAAVGTAYLLRLQEPAGTAERVLEYGIQSFDVPIVTPLGGSYFTNLSHLKEFIGIGDPAGSVASGSDPVLTNLIGRATVEIQSFLNRVGIMSTYTERYDGKGSPWLWVKEWPITSITSIHESIDQTFDATTLIPSTDYIFDLNLPRIRHKWRGWFTWFQSIQVIYVGGWVTVPLDVEQVCIELAAMKFQARGALVLASTALGDGSVSIMREPMLTRQMKARLEPYRNEVSV